MKVSGKAYIDFVGMVWHGYISMIRIPLTDQDLDSIKSFDRDSFEDWLSHNIPDFRSIIDFRVRVGAQSIDFQDPKYKNMYFPYIGEKY